MPEHAGGTAFWLGVGDHSVAAVLHAAAVRSGVGVVLLPPFGWEETSSHRSVRLWADELAAAGHAALRLDWPGTGDSSGPEPAPLSAWIQTVEAAVDLLRHDLTCTSITAVGLGLGGLVAVLACVEGVDLDDLVLWGAPASGRGAVRRLKATAALLGGAEVDAAGALHVFGYALPAQLAADLVAPVDLSTARRVGRRVLGLDDGGDLGLVEGLGAAGAEVRLASAPPFDTLVEHPQTSQVPAHVVAEVNDWLAARAEVPVATGRSRTSPPAGLPPTGLPTTVRLPSAAEELVELPSPAGPLRAVLTRPVVAAETPLTVLLYNSGATRRTGPNRMWVDAARRWAASGVSVVRVDLAGFGESGDHVPSPRETEAFYSDGLERQVRALLDALPDIGVPDRVLLAGLCSGAYSSWQVAADDPRVVGAVLLNPAVLYALPVLMAARASHDLRKLATFSTWRKLAEGRIPRRHFAAVFRATALRIRRTTAFRRESRDAYAALDRDAERMLARRVRVATVFSPGENLLLQLEAARRLDRLEQPPHMTVHRLQGREEDHTFASPGLRCQAERVLDDVVRELMSG